MSKLANAKLLSGNIKSCKIEKFQIIEVIINLKLYHKDPLCESTFQMSFEKILNVLSIVKTWNHPADIVSLILMFEFISDWSVNSYTIRDIEAYSTETYLYLYLGN